MYNGEGLARGIAFTFLLDIVGAISVGVKNATEKSEIWTV